MDSADLTRLLRGVVLQVTLQAHEDRLHLHRRHVLEQYRVAPLQRGIHAGGRQRPARRRGQRPGQRVPPEELVLALPFHHVGSAQEAAVVLAHQQREIRLLLHETLLVQAGVDDHLAHRQRQRRIGADPDRLVVVRVNRRGAVVRGDRHYLAAVVSGLGHEVVPLDVGVDRVRVPDQRQLRQEPVVHARGRVVETPGDVPARTEVLELRVAIGGRRPQCKGVVTGGPRPDLGCERGDDRFHALVLDGVEHGVGDVAQRLVPGHRFELSLAPLTDPLEGLGHAVGGVVAVAPAGALLAPHRVQVGHSGLGRRPQGRLLLADDLVALGVDAEGTAARVAVHRVAAEGHLVPGPLLAIPIRPCSRRSRHRCSPLPALNRTAQLRDDRKRSTQARCQITPPRRAIGSEFSCPNGQEGLSYRPFMRALAGLRYDHGHVSGRPSRRSPVRGPRICSAFG